MQRYSIRAVSNNNNTPAACHQALFYFCAEHAKLNERAAYFEQMYTDVQRLLKRTVRCALERGQDVEVLMPESPEASLRSCLVKLSLHDIVARQVASGSVVCPP